MIDGGGAPAGGDQGSEEGADDWRARALTAEGRFDSIVEAGPYGILVFDGEGRLVFANGIARQVLETGIEGSRTGPTTVAVPGRQGRVEFGVRPITWDGHRASLVVVAALGPVAAGSSGGWMTGIDAEPSSQGGQAVETPGGAARAVVCVVDELQRFEDLFGSAVSEALAAEISARIGRLLGDPAAVRRRGRSEFLVVEPESGPEAERLAAAIRAALDEPIGAGGVRITLSAEVRVVPVPGEGRGRPGQGKRDRVRGALFSGGPHQG